MARQAIKGGLLFSGSDWDFKTLSRTYDAIEAIAVEELHLDT